MLLTAEVLFRCAIYAASPLWCSCSSYGNCVSENVQFRHCKDHLSARARAIMLWRPAVPKLQDPR